LVCASCEPSDIGAALQPEEDKMVVQTDSFYIQSATELLAVRHSESDKIELGYLCDPVYGNVKLDFLAEFRYSRDTFPASATDAVLRLVMYYRSYYGDSLAVNEASVYALQSPLDFEENYTSDIDVSKFCDKSVLLAKKSYVAYDATVPNSERKKADYCDKVVIDLPQSYCTELMTNRAYNKSQEAFLNFLNGVYVTTQYGSRTVLNVDSVNLEVSYRYIPDAAKPDSMANGKRIYPANRETTTVVRVSEVEAPLDIDADSLNYIVSSSGYVTRLTLPLNRIKETIEGEETGEKLNLNYMSLILEEASVDDGLDTRMTPPDILLLIQAKDLEKFFTQSKYPADGIETTLGVYVPEKKYYLFNNMASYMEGLMSDNTVSVDDLNDFYVLPITGATDIAGSNAVVRHLFKPYAVRLRSATNQHSPMRLVVTYSNL
jgi:hypothetical protein